MKGGWLALLGHKTTSIPKKESRNRLRELQEEKNVLVRKYREKIDHLNWVIALTKEHLSLPYRKHKWV